MTLEARAIGALIVLAVLGGAAARLWYLEGAVDRAREATQVAEAERDAAREDAAATAALLADKIAADRALAARLQALTRSIGDIRNADPAVASWLDAPLPAGLRGVRDVPGPAADAAGGGADAGPADDVVRAPAD